MNVCLGDALGIPAEGAVGEFDGDEEAIHEELPHGDDQLALRDVVCGDQRSEGVQACSHVLGCLLVPPRKFHFFMHKEKIA